MKNFLTIFPQESLDCSFDQIFDKVLPEVWEILFHFLKLFIFFIYICFYPMIYLIIKTFSRKVTLYTENVMSTKLPKNFLLKVQKLLCSKSQNSCGNLLKRNCFFFKVPSGQLKCSFENPVGNSSPGVSKNHTQSRIENFKKLFFWIFFLGKVFWTP